MKLERLEEEGESAQDGDFEKFEKEREYIHGKFKREGKERLKLSSSGEWEKRVDASKFRREGKGQLELE